MGLPFSGNLGPAQLPMHRITDILKYRSTERLTYRKTDHALHLLLHRRPDRWPTQSLADYQGKSCSSSTPPASADSLPNTKACRRFTPSTTCAASKSSVSLEISPDDKPGPTPTSNRSCDLNYGVQFPIFSKIDVNGDAAHPLISSSKPRNLACSAAASAGTSPVPHRPPRQRSQTLRAADPARHTGIEH